jgi:hypothetical protein
MTVVRRLAFVLAFAATGALTTLPATAGSPPPTPSSPSARPPARAVGCSTREAICIHAVDGTSLPSAALERVLASAERALAFLRRQGLPAPLTDGSSGGGPELDLYLQGGVLGSTARPDTIDLIGVHEAAAAYGILDAEATGCRLESDIARTIAQASYLGLAPASHPSTLAIGASHLAALAAPCPPLEAEAVDAMQRHPERALTHARLDRFAGESLWADHLDTRYGHREPGRLWAELVALTGQRTPADARGLRAEPDVFDVLRRLLSVLGTSLDDAQLEFAVARGFVGSRSDGAHLPDVERFGDLGAVRFDWAIDWKSLPRRLRTSETEATGASYLWLDVRGAASGARLDVAVECEATYAFRWALVTLDAEGKELGRHVGGRWGEREVQLSLASLEGVATVMLVGAAGGHDDREHPFDPDEGLPAGAVCEVTLHPG